MEAARKSWVVRARIGAALVCGSLAASTSLATGVPLPNPSFEEGYVEWTLGFTSLAAIATETSIGLAFPSDGGQMSLQVAGMMLPAATEAYMGLPFGTLQLHYESIGGLGDVGNYSVIRRMLPQGTYAFDWLVEDGDIENPELLDHTFIVADGDIYPINNGLEPVRTTWQSLTFSTQGGAVYIVAANGGDVVLGPFLYVDNLRHAAPPACPGDADADELVGLADVAVVIQNWGQDGFTGGDLDGDFSVGLTDIAMVIQNWGTSCGELPS